VKYELPSTKTYSREVMRLFTKDEVAGLLKEAHAHCKAQIKVSYHGIGRTRRRNVITRPASEYQSCIKEYINKKIQERIPK
jgi:hypothetical protein